MATVRAGLRPKAKKNRIRPKLKPIAATNEDDDEGLGYGEWASSPVTIRSKGSGSEEDEKKHEDPNGTATKLEKAMMSARLQPFLIKEEMKTKEGMRNEHARALPTQSKRSFDNRLHLSQSIKEGKAIDSKATSATTILIEDNLNLQMFRTRILKGLAVLLWIAFSFEVFSIIVIAKVKMSHDGLYDNERKVWTPNNDNTSTGMVETGYVEVLSSLKEGIDEEPHMELVSYEDEVAEPFNPVLSKEEILSNELHGNKDQEEEKIEMKNDDEQLVGNHEPSFATEGGKTEVEQLEIEDFLSKESFRGNNEQHSDKELESDEQKLDSKSEGFENSIDQPSAEKKTESESDMTEMESDILSGDDKLDDAEESLQPLEEVDASEMTEQISSMVTDEDRSATYTPDLAGDDKSGDNKSGTTDSSIAEIEGFDSEIAIKQSEDAIKIDESGSNSVEESLVPDKFQRDDEEASSDTVIESFYGSHDRPDVTEEMYAYSVKESPEALQEDLKIDAEELSTKEEGELISLSEMLESLKSSHDWPDAREEESGTNGVEETNVEAASCNDKLDIETTKSLMASEEMDTDEMKVQTTSVIISEEPDATNAHEELGEKSGTADSEKDFENLDDTEMVIKQPDDTNAEHESGSMSVEGSLSDKNEPDMSADINLSPPLKEAESDEDRPFDASLSGEKESGISADNFLSSPSRESELDEDEHFHDAELIYEVVEDKMSTGDDDNQNQVVEWSSVTERDHFYIDNEEHGHGFELTLHTSERKRGALVKLNEFKETFERYEIIDAIIGHVVCAIPKLLWNRIVGATVSIKARFPKKSHDKDEIGI